MGFEVGDVVESLVSAQGMVRGGRYVVRERKERRTFAGTFSRYRLVPEGMSDRMGEGLWVGNGHLVLRAVES